MKVYELIRLLAKRDPYDDVLYAEDEHGRGDDLAEHRLQFEKAPRSGDARGRIRTSIENLHCASAADG